MTGFYTRKQLWRRVNSYNIRHIEGDINIPVKLNEKKHVSFNNDVKVVLIPEIKEYINSRIMYNLWYNKNDYSEFIRDRKNELLNKKYHSI